MKKTEAPFVAIRHPKKRAFLSAYSKLGSEIKAASAAKIDRTTVWFWKQSDPEFVAALEQAHGFAAAELEEVARRRAIQGWEDPVYQGGELVGTIRRFSDTLLIFLLKGARPDRYVEPEIRRSSGGRLNNEGISNITIQLIADPLKILEVRRRICGSGADPRHSGGNGQSGPVGALPAPGAS